MSDSRLPMQEHQSPDPTEVSNLASQSEGEKKLVEKVMKMFNVYKNNRQRYDQKWLYYYKMFRGEQWQTQRPSYRHSEVVNLIFTSIQSSVPVMMDARPKIDFIPTDPSDRNYAEIMSQVMEFDWETKNWAIPLLEVIYDAHLSSTGFSSLQFNPKEDYGMGCIEYYSEDPFYMYFDPSALDINKKCRGVIKAYPVDVDILKKEYPDKADSISADLSSSEEYSKTDLGQVRYKSPLDTKVIVEGSNPASSLVLNRALKIEAYFFDDDTEEVDVEVEIEESPGVKAIGIEKQTKKKYVRPRKICICNGVLLSDEELPYEHGLFPFSKVNNYILPREFYGISEVEQLDSPQKIFNKLISFALDVLTLMGNPIWLVPSASGIDEDNLVNRPGLAVPYDNQPPTRVEGTQLQPYVLQMIDRMETWFNQVSGISEVTRGIAPASVTANAAIENLQQASQTRIRQKMRLMDYYLQDVGRQYAELVMQYYTVPRVYRITNNSGADKYFKFHVEHGGDGKKYARLRPYYEDQNGQFQAKSEDMQFEIRGRLDVRANTSSSLPFSKAEKEQKALQLFDRGIIDAEEVLSITDYPNKEKVLERLKQAAEAQAQQGGK